LLYFIRCLPAHAGAIYPDCPGFCDRAGDYLYFNPAGVKNKKIYNRGYVVFHSGGLGTLVGSTATPNQPKHSGRIAPIPYKIFINLYFYIREMNLSLPLVKGVRRKPGGICVFVLHSISKTLIRIPSCSAAKNKLLPSFRLQ